MKKSLRFQSVLLLLLHVFLLILLLWAANVPLEQIKQHAADNIGEIRNRIAFQQNLVQVETLIWSALVLAAVIGFVITWTVSRRVLIPILSIRNTVRQVSLGDMDALFQVHSGNEFGALANELNRIMEHRKQERERLLGINRTLSAISACRRAMIHETDEARLNQEICRILVDIGAYRVAWIGYAKDDTDRTVTPAALAVYQNGDLNTVSATWVKMAFSPTVRAIRNRHPAIISDVFGDYLFAPLQSEATLHGYSSIMALPLSVNQQVTGVLTLYAEKPDSFGTEEVRLLTELADDMACFISGSATVCG
jgi:HAMP domain-containing protein